MKAVLLVSCTLIALFQAVDGFAAWLVDRELGCWTYLTEGEVIMNHGVVAAASSQYPDIHLQVFRDGQLVEPDPTTMAIPVSPNGETIRVRLFTPEEMGRVDVQFVVEATKGAKFTAPYVGCEGKRSAGKKKTSEMTLVLSGEEETVELVAGWATGHSAVTLTPKVILKREDAPADSAPGELMKEEVENVNAGAAAIENLQEPRDAVDTEVPKEIIKEAVTESIEESKDNAAEDGTAVLKSQRKQIIEALDEKRGMYMEDNRINPSDRIDDKRKQVAGDQRPKDSRGLSSKLQRMQKKYGSDDFGSSSFSMKSFAYACVFSLVFIIGVAQFAAKAPHGQEKDL